jgi:8-oxo-dGTP diphosphatase
MADRGAGVALFDADGRVLMIKEAYGRRRWGLPGGGQEPGEDSRRTAVREAKEETGLDVKLGDLVGEYRISYGDGGVPLIVSVYDAEIAGGSLRPNEGEIADIAWIDPDALPEPLTNVAPVAIPDAVHGVRGAVRSIRATSRNPL